MTDSELYAYAFGEPDAGFRHNEASEEVRDEASEGIRVEDSSNEPNREVSGHGAFGHDANHEATSNEPIIGESVPEASSGNTNATENSVADQINDLPSMVSDSGESDSEDELQGYDGFYLESEDDVIARHLGYDYSRVFGYYFSSSSLFDPPDV